jgi:WD40 repeat protein
LNMWDLKTGNEMPLPNIPNARGEAVSFSSDGKFLAFGSNNGFYLIDWDNQTYEKYKAPSTVQSIAFINKNREVLISGWTGFVQRIHLESKEILWQHKGEDWLINLKILPNETSALVISPFYVLHLDWENDKVTNTNISVRTAMDLHPDGKTILTAGQFANRVEQFDWQTKKPINNSQFYTEPPMKLAFSPDGKYLAAGPYFTADKAVFWETENWIALGTIEGNKLHGFENFTFTKDGKYFHATMKKNNARLPMTDLPSYYKVPSFEPAKFGFGKSKAYHHAAVNLESTQTVHLKSQLPIKTAAFFGTLDDSMNRHLFGGWTIEKAYFAGVTNENMLYIFDSKTGKKVAGTPLPDFQVVACAIHPEAKVVAVTAFDGLIYIYKW